MLQKIIHTPLATVPCKEHHQDTPDPRHLLGTTPTERPIHHLRPHIIPTHKIPPQTLIIIILLLLVLLRILLIIRNIIILPIYLPSRQRIPILRRHLRLRSRQIPPLPLAPNPMLPSRGKVRPRHARHRRRRPPKRQSRRGRRRPPPPLRNPIIRPANIPLPLLRVLMPSPHRPPRPAPRQHPRPAAPPRHQPLHKRTPARRPPVHPHPRRRGVRPWRHGRQGSGGIGAPHLLACGVHAPRHGDLGVRGDDGDVDAVGAGVGGPGRGGSAAREVRGDGVEAVVGGDAGGGAVGAAVGGGWGVVGGRWLSRGGRGEALLWGVVVVVVGRLLLGVVVLLGVVLLVRVLRRRMRLALGMMCGVNIGERVRGHLALLVAWLGRRTAGGGRMEATRRHVDT